MWPRLLDMEAPECRQVLRRLELEAYASLVSVFRAQGDLTPEKKSILKSVASTMSISTERHKAEVRRAVNDEKLTTIAERIGGDTSSTEWLMEGRRLIPLMPRFVPQTAFTVTANQIANLVHAHNATLPDPQNTAKIEGDESKSSQENMAATNHIVLPPGTVLPKAMPDLQQLEDQAKQHHPSSSSAFYSASPASFLSALTSAKLSQAASVSSTSSASESRSKVRSSSGGAMPATMKVTYAKVGSATTLTSSQAGQKQVIIMSSTTATSPSASASSASSDILHRSQSLPASTKVTMTTMEGHKDHMTGVVPPYQPAPKHHRSKGSSKAHKAHSKAMSMQQQQQQTTGSPGVSAIGSSAYSTAVTASEGVAPVGMGVGGGGRKAVMATQRPEPGMKLITQTVASSPGRVMSKGYQVPASSASPSIRTTTIGVQAPRTTVNTGSSSPVLGVRNVAAPGPRIVTVPSQMGGRPPSSSTNNVITLSPMTLQKSGAKGGTTTTVVVTKPGSVVPGKTNVIVVQKSQIKSKMISSPRSGAPGITTHTTSILTRPKIAMTMTSGVAGVGGAPILPPRSPGSLSYQTVRFPTPSSSSSSGPTPALHYHKAVRGPSPMVMAGVTMGGATIRGRSSSPMGISPVAKNQGTVRPKGSTPQTMASLSADLDPQAQAKVQGQPRSLPGTVAQGQGQGPAKVVVEEVPGSAVKSSSLAAGGAPSLVFPSGSSKPNTEWIEYDGSPPPAQSASSAIKALLEIRGHPLPTTSAVKQVPLSGVAPGIPPSTVSKQSTIMRRIPMQATVAATTTASSPLSEQTKKLPPNPSPKSATGGERLEFSTDQLSAVVEQFEQFLESEESVGGKAPSAINPRKATGGKTAPKEMPAAKETPAVKVDPFEFVEEIIAAEAETLAATKKPRAVSGQDEAGPHPAERSQVIGQKSSAQPQSTPGVSQQGRATVTRVTPVVSEAPSTSAVSITTGPPAASVGPDVSAGPDDSTVPDVSTGPDVSAAPATSVVMESSSSFDITQMNLEDLSCQRMQEEEDDEEDGEEEGKISSELASFMDTSSGGSGSEGMVGADGNLRVSRRKRKAPTPIDEETGPSSMPSWARAAWNLLQRVMRFRGANRPKGGINAASWFTRPVDPSEAPGYHKLIKKPMDFGTIKRHLEAASYQDFSEFHHDMMLVRSNCLQYNPPGHAARRDCEEVFQFYTSEYSKTLERWQKQLLQTPKSPKRMRSDPGVAPPPAPPL